MNDLSKMLQEIRNRTTKRQKLYFKLKHTNMKKGGMSLATILVIVFAVLKLVGTITWSWWWVISPWIFAFLLSWIVLPLIVLLLGFLFGGSIALFSFFKRKR